MASSAVDSLQPSSPRKSGGPPGSYMVIKQIKESSLHTASIKASSPLKHMSRPGSPTRELAAARAELARVHQQNTELLTKLTFVESRVPGLAKLLGLQLPTGDGTVVICAHRPSTTPTKLQKAKQASTEPVSPAPAASTAVPLVVDDLLLSQAEVEEAAMRTCWIAHYWERAELLGICPDIAAENAAHWQGLAMPLVAYLDCAMRTVLALVPSKQRAQYGQAAQSGPEGTAAEAITKGHRPNGGGATSSDLLEVERASRQLAELGVMEEVHASLLHHRQLQLSAQGGAALHMVSSPEIDPEDSPLLGSGTLPNQPRSPGTGSTSYGSMDEEEVLFQRAWVSYLWARAVGAGIAPYVAPKRAEHWAHQFLAALARTGHAVPLSMDQPPAADAVTAAGDVSQELCEVSDALLEISRLGLEVHLWQRRGGA